jgi:hypothetical protein
MYANSIFALTPSHLLPLDIILIVWQCPKGGVCVLDLFERMNMSLVAMLQVGISMHKRVHMSSNKPKLMLKCQLFYNYCYIFFMRSHFNGM